MPACLGTNARGHRCKNEVSCTGERCHYHNTSHSEPKPKECVICTENLDDEIPLSCGHWIHRHCVVQSGKSECPMCRQPVRLTSQEKKQIKREARKLESNNMIQAYFSIPHPPPELNRNETAAYFAFHFDSVREEGGEY